ncbi:hypothetical protein DM01DRAFT_1298902 [Hesseltinella vesiculosa]|uniref:Amino acid transporter transmembrane domain-containing protein n=1 Tax=Hesseltinella vesiculosa TaxID=101127 RepID=A0A1X2GW54_9FUNG|nr:hypothetical protein DM01DRAFT_1298902 [Hesseltinella vesiculosa]
MNLVNAMMGSGIIGLPLAIHLCGFWLGIVCSILMGILTCLAIHLTVVCGMHANCYGLDSLCGLLFGRYGHFVCNLVLLFHTGITSVSYYIMLADISSCLIEFYLPQFPILANRVLIVGFLGVAVGLPLSLPRSPAQLANWSTLSVIFLPLMQVGVMLRLHYYVPDWHEIELEVQPLSQDTFKGIAIMALSFGCSQNIFGLYLSTRDQRPRAWLTISVIATVLCYVFNYTFAILGYLCFGKNVQANVLLNFPLDDTCINLVRLFLAIFLVITVPMCMYPCRDALQSLRGKSTFGQGSSDLDHNITTCLLFAPILYLGATLTSLGTVFDIIGGVSTMLLGFLLPGAAFFKLYFGKPVAASKPLLYTPPPMKPLNGTQACVAACLLVVGTMILFFTLADYL